MIIVNNYTRIIKLDHLVSLVVLRFEIVKAIYQLNFLELKGLKKATSSAPYLYILV